MQGLDTKFLISESGRQRKTRNTFQYFQDRLSQGKTFWVDQVVLSPGFMVLATAGSWCLVSQLHLGPQTVPQTCFIRALDICLDLLAPTAFAGPLSSEGADQRHCSITATKKSQLYRSLGRLKEEIWKKERELGGRKGERVCEYACMLCYVVLCLELFEKSVGGS